MIKSRIRINIFVLLALIFSFFMEYFFLVQEVKSYNLSRGVTSYRILFDLNDGSAINYMTPINCTDIHKFSDGISVETATGSPCERRNFSIMKGGTELTSKLDTSSHGGSGFFSGYCAYPMSGDVTFKAVGNGGTVSINCPQNLLPRDSQFYAQATWRSSYAGGGCIYYLSGCQITTAYNTKENLPYSRNVPAGTAANNIVYNAGHSTTTISLPKPSREGYVFIGWYTSDNTKIDNNSIINSDYTLYAKWQSTTTSYTVAFNNQSATSVGTNSISVRYNSNLPNITPPSKIGYSFQGYYTGQNGTGKKYFDSNGKPTQELSDFTSNATLYAYWNPIPYTIGFNTNGGNSISDISYNIVSNQTLPTPIKYGYNFNGWKPSSSSSSGNWSSGTTYLAGKSLNGMYGEVTLIAQWTAKNFNVVYYSNYGTNRSTSQGANFGEDVTLKPSSTFTRTGYTFVGWSKSNTSTSPEYNAGSSYVMITQETGVNLYAIWRKNTYYVRYNANVSGRGVDSNCQSSDSVIGTMPNSTHYYDTPKNLTNNAFARRGYSFQGWSTDYNAISATYGNNASINNLTTTDKATVDLYAIWKRNSYTISFDANGGNGTTSSLTMLYNSGNKILPKCGYSRPGYVFEGWTTNPDGTGTIYKDCATVNSYDYVSNVTLYAKWKATWMADVMTRTTPLKGSGTQSNPYKIETADDLAYLSRLVQEGNAFSVGASQEYFEQTAPIDLSGKIWLPIGGNSLGSTTASFGGVYNGKGFAIMGLETYSQTDASGNYIYNSIGLFGKTSGAYLQDINLFNAKIYGKDSVGALVGENTDKNLTIIGCFARANVNGISNVGGLVGNDKISGTQILNSGFAGNVNGESIMVGSMAGGVIRDCYAEVNTNIVFCGSSSGVTIDACVFETSSGKYYYSDKTTKNGITFDGWTTYQGKPLPSGITWVGGVSSTGATLDGYIQVD